MRHFVFDLFFVRLRNLIILAIDTAQIAVAEEDISGAACAGQRRLFTKVRGVRRNDRKTAGKASRQLTFHSVVAAIQRADRATFEQGFERFHTALQLAVRSSRSIAKARLEVSCSIITAATGQ